MYRIIVGSLEEQCIDVDQAMNMCFDIFPAAEFKGWNETESKTWLDIVNGNDIVGEIIEGNNIV